MMGNSSSQTKAERQQRCQAIDSAVGQAQRNLDNNLHANATNLLENAQRDQNNQPIIDSDQRDLMHMKHGLNEVKKQQLERKQDNFTKADLIAILGLINGDSDIMMTKYNSLTCGELRAMIRQYVYNPQFKQSLMQQPEYVKQQPLQQPQQPQQQQQLVTRKRFTLPPPSTALTR